MGVSVVTKSYINEISAKIQCVSRNQATQASKQRPQLPPIAIKQKMILANLSDLSVNAYKSNLQSSTVRLNSVIGSMSSREPLLQSLQLNTSSELHECIYLDARE